MVRPIEGYLAAMPTMPYAFGYVDAAIVRAVDAVQREHGVGGDILQIGARYGAR